MRLIEEDHKINFPSSEFFSGHSTIAGPLYTYKAVVLPQVRNYPITEVISVFYKQQKQNVFIYVYNVDYIIDFRFV